MGWFWISVILLLFGFWCHTEEGRRQLENSGLTREDLIKHFCEVNNCSRREFGEYEEEAFRIWRERSKHKWKQDFGGFDPSL